MDIDENISVVAYDPRWQLLFKDEATSIKEVLDFYPIHIEHIGSTTIEGLYAKPIVDIQIGIESWNYLDEIKCGLIILGYHYLGEAGVVGRHYFRKRNGNAFNVHVVLWNSDLWINNLLIRDYLKNNKEAANGYGHLKMEAIRKGITKLLAYSDHKADYIRKILETAKIWQERI